jgi:hypothetical protein
MTDLSPPAAVTRRTLLKAAVAGLASGSLGRLASPLRADEPVSSEKAIGELYRSLTPEQRKQVCFDRDLRVNIEYGRTPLWYPDPGGVLLRTHVSNAWKITSPLVASDFYTDEQRALILGVLGTTFTPEWVSKLRQQARDDSGLDWGGDQAIAIFGEPAREPCDCLITGFHLTARASSDSHRPAAFGGGITHGHQPSGFYEKFHHPGNFFWPQALAANEIYRLFDDAGKKLALVQQRVPWFTRDGLIDRTVITPETSWDAPRHEQDIRFRRPGDPPLGVPVAQFGREQRGALDALLASLLAPYRQRYQDEIHDCLQRQGGLEACSLAFYQDRDMGQDGVWDIWRLEGPGLTWFFRGSPHVHIWIHVASDPQAPISSYFG